MQDLGTDVVERIRFYRFNSLALILTIVAPLVCGVILSLAMFIAGIAQGKSWLWNHLRDFNFGLAVLMAVVVPLLFVTIAALRVRSRMRQNLKDFYRETDFDQAEYASWSSALEGVSLGMGLALSPLEVLGMPSVNSLAFRREGLPHVGITAEALRAGLSRPEKEAMMAHEVAHIALGDYFLASSSAGFEYAAYGTGMLFLLMAILVAIVVSPYLLLFLLPLFVPLLISLADRKLRQERQLLYRHNDLLADSVAAKLLSDPACLRDAIQKCWELSEKTKAVIPGTAHFQRYLFVWRPLDRGAVKMVTYDGAAAPGSAGVKPNTTKIYWVPGKGGTRTSLAHDAVQARIANLEAIERGHWIVLTRPDRRERVRNIAALAGVALVVVLAIVALFLPWHGRNLWDYATAFVVWRI